MGVVGGSWGHKTLAGRRRIDESPRPGPVPGKIRSGGKEEVRSNANRPHDLPPTLASWRRCGQSPPFVGGAIPGLLVGYGVGVSAPAASYFGVWWPVGGVAHFGAGVGAAFWAGVPANYSRLAGGYYGSVF